MRGTPDHAVIKPYPSEIQAWEILPQSGKPLALS
jgi:hypothetical protein